jgi:segregation and condensation protein A
VHQIKLHQHQFEGPLDLLLNLIEEQKLDITQITLANVTEQFLAYIKELEQVDPTVLADYLSIAAKLLVIKSKAILPTLEIDEEDEEIGGDLTEKLILYKQFKEVAKHLKQLDNGNQSFTRQLTFSERISFLPDPSVATDTLHTSILGVLQGLKELDNLPKAKIKEAISIQEKIDHLQSLITNQIETKLSTLLATAKNRGEVIITFLALLELTKQKILTVEQETLFTDITIKKYEHQEIKQPFETDSEHDTITKENSIQETNES